VLLSVTACKSKIGPATLAVATNALAISINQVAGVIEGEKGCIIHLSIMPYTMRSRRVELIPVFELIALNKPT
jgi:hypothetical protein